MMLFVQKIKETYGAFSLKQKLAASYIVVFMLPLMVFICYLARLTTTSALEKTQASSISTLQQITSNVDVLLNSAVNISRMVVANSFVQEYYSTPATEGNATKRFSLKSQTAVFFDSIIEPKSNIHSIAIYTPQNDLITSGRLDERRLSNRYYDTKGRETSPPMTMTDSWGDLIGIDHFTVYSHDGETDCLSVLKPVILVRTGLPGGYAQINMDTQVILDFYQDIGYPKGGHIFFATPEGELISSKDVSPLYDGLSRQAFFQWAKENPNQGKVFQIGGVSYLVTSTRYDSIGWIAMGIIPMSAITNQALHQVLLSFGFLLFSVGTIALFSSLFISSITRPIDHLIASMEGAAQGDLSVSVEVTSRDEIAKLSSSFNNMIVEISRLVEEVSSEKLMKKQSQLLALQAQINPHFLYNSLESIKALIQLGQPQDAFDMTQSLEVFYRTSLSKGQTIIKLEEEFENVSHYLRIQKTRYFDRLDYEIHFDKALGEYPIAKLSVQPLVENAIYHGIRQIPSKGMILVDCRSEQQRIIISVEDNGPGFPGEKLDTLLEKGGTSYGLSNVNQRIKLYFGSAYGIRIDSTRKAGAKVELVLPMTMDRLF